MGDNLIGRRFKSNGSGWFTTIERVPDTKKVIKYVIEFDEVNNVKFSCVKRKDSILNGEVKNPFFPSVCGVGYLGNAYDNIDRKLYQRWSNILKRCYEPSNPAYPTYGGIGVKVDSRWLCYDNFQRDFIRIDGYDKDRIDNLEIDKDIKLREAKIYSLETCTLVPRKDNFEEMMNRKRLPFVAVSPQGVCYESDNQREFSEEHGLSYKNVNQVLQNKRSSHKGWTFKFKEEN